MTEKLKIKYQKLQKYLQKLGSVAVAFSSGVDSTFLLQVAHDILGDKAIAVTAKSCSFPERELIEATTFCESLGIKHIICNTEELKIVGFRENHTNRCYLCKREIFEKMWSVAKENNINMVVEGSNVDDEGDYRPGLLAIKELRVASPLRYAGLTKKEIRELSKELNLVTWDKPSFACLASRFVYGEVISKEKLAMVDQAEQLLFDMGFAQFRVRIHGTLARIEVLPEEFSKIMEAKTRETIYRTLKSYGFSYVALDLTGYRMGSMNEMLDINTGGK